MISTEGHRSERERETWEGLGEEEVEEGRRGGREWDKEE